MLCCWIYLGFGALFCQNVFEMLLKLHVCGLALFCISIIKADELARLSNCRIPKEMRAKWQLMEDPRIILRIRAKNMVFKQPGRPTLRYKCLEARGSTFLLRSRKISPDKDGVVCVGIAEIEHNPSMAEYRVYRLVAPSYGHSLMGPLVVDTGSWLSIDSTCTGVNTSISSYLKRTGPGCRFPRELRRSWMTSLMFAWNMTFTRSDFTITLSNSSSFTFRCERRDIHFYVLRAHNMLPDRDGILCVEILPLVDDHYSFKLSRMNSGVGQSIDDMVRYIPRGENFHQHSECDWVDSPARPFFIYPT